MNKEKMSMTISPENIKKVTAYSKKKGMSKSACVDRIITKHFERLEKKKGMK